MTSQLEECSILVVEYDVIIAVDVADLLECAGAHVVITHSSEAAAMLLDTDPWSAVLLDHKLGETDGSSLCELLTQRQIPFLRHAGCEPDHASLNGEIAHKPAPSALLVQRVEELVRADRLMNNFDFAI